MPAIYNLFISHSWSYGAEYGRLCALLDGAAPDFRYRNYSVPKDDPVHDAPSAPALSRAIKAQMTFCHVVLVISGVYASYSEWIDRELQLATQDFRKPILAIRPWGTQRASRLVEEHAAKTVNWSTSSIVSAIRDLTA